MADTTTTTLTTVVPSEYIAAQVVAAAYPFNVVAPLVFNGIQPLGKGKVFSRPILPTNTAAAVDEGSDITASAQTTTEANITMGEVGLSVSLTKFAGEIAVVANNLGMWAGECGKAIGQKVTGDLCALFAALNSSTAIGTSGSDITVDYFLTAMYTLDAANAPGQKRCVLHPRQFYDLASALTGSGAIYQNLPELIREGRLPGGQPAAGFAGALFGVPIYITTEVDAVNSSADRCGAIFVPDALGFVQLRPITAEYDGDASARTTEVVVTAAYGVGEIVDGYGVPIETDA